MEHRLLRTEFEADEYFNGMGIACKIRGWAENMPEKFLAGSLLSGNFAAAEEFLRKETGHSSPSFAERGPGC